jgi:hypothetical protein
MRAGDDYRDKAAEIYARAASEPHAATQVELESLARAYRRLAEQADRNSTADLVYFTPDHRQDSSEA